MRYAPQVMPHQSRLLPDGHVLVTSCTGDHAFFDPVEFEQFQHRPGSFGTSRQADLRARFLLGDVEPSRGIRRLMTSRIAAKRETVDAGPALHIIVPTLQCAHSCRYCQVSRSLESQGHTMSVHDLDAACDTVFEGATPALTVEFQGGDPLLRFDLVKHAILRIQSHNTRHKRRIRFVVASTLHPLNSDMCDFFRVQGVYLSTSLDGPKELHNANRPIPGKNAYERTVAGRWHYASDTTLEIHPLAGTH